MRELSLADAAGRVVGTLEAPGRRFRGLLVPRPSVEILVEELPPLSQAEAEAAVRHRLPAVYLGDVGKAALELRRGAGARGAALALVADGGFLAELRGGGRAGVRAELVSSTLLLARLLPAKGRAIGVFLADDWAEIVRVEDGRILSSVARERKGAAPEDLARWSAEGALGAEEPLFFLSAREAGLAEGDPGGVGAGIARPPVRLEPSAAAMKAPEAAVFRAPGDRRSLSAVAPLALLLLDLALAAAGVHRYAAYRERELAGLKVRYEEQKDRRGEAARLRSELIALEGRHDELLESTPADAYAAVSAIVASLGDSVRIGFLEYRGAEFSLEAEGADALGVLGRFESSGRFSGLKLGRAGPAPTRGERFAISGRFAR